MIPAGQSLFLGGPTAVNHLTLAGREAMRWEWVKVNFGTVENPEINIRSNVTITSRINSKISVYGHALDITTPC